MTGVRQVQVVLPGDVDDPALPSGGNTYDRRLCQGLAGSGWSVREHALPGPWPRPDAPGRDALARTLAEMADGAVGLLDGVVAGGSPDIVVPESRRLRLVLLVHLPLADETGLAPEAAAALDDAERRTLRAAAAVVATSTWAARRLIDHHQLSADQVHVAAPGVDPAPLAPGTDGATRLLCPAAVTPRKGQDLLVTALAQLADLAWTCECAGALERAPGFAAQVRRSVQQHGLADRIRLLGPRTGADLAAAYAAADVMVLPSRAETYGMVVTEALARGIPVIAARVGGVPEALGRAPDGTLPGMLVPPADPAALAGALRHWLTRPDTRQRLKDAAGSRRAGLPGWETTARAVARVLASGAAR